MPNNTPQPQQSQPPQMPQPGQMQAAQGGQSQGKQEINPEKMLLEFLKGLEQKVEELSQRVDVLEQGSNQAPE